jgi:hypothetical protein
MDWGSKSTGIQINWDTAFLGKLLEIPHELHTSIQTGRVTYDLHTGSKLVFSVCTLMQYRQKVSYSWSTNLIEAIFYVCEKYQFLCPRFLPSNFFILSALLDIKNYRAQ